jgi:hypothetical protein
MAQKTKAQILAEIASLLADNTTGDISASDVRTVVNDITDSYEDLITAGTTSQYWRGDKTWQTLPSYKIYAAKMYQTSTNAPVMTVAQNTLGFNPTWSRVSAGVYEMTNTQQQDWNAEKVIVLSSNFDKKGTDYVIVTYYDAEFEKITINTYDSGVLSDGVLGDDDNFYRPSIEIHIYS